MLVLGIESSCDETGFSLVEDGGKCLFNFIHSQISDHAPFRGIVPEIASRAHLENINLLYANLKNEYSNTFGKALDFDYIAVSTQPGLIGSLMIGASFAKCLALVHKKPIIQVNHLEAHLYAPCLEGWIPKYPFLGLVLSGGNSAIYQIEAPNQVKTIADTLDDACGEAFDKVASILNLSYPGGPNIEKIAKQYHIELQNQKREKEGSLFPPLLKNNKKNTNIAFSFSGIKTGVLLAHQRNCNTSKICYDFQETVFELVQRNILKAVQLTGINTILAGGGVLANETLRNTLNDLASKNSLEIIFPKNKVYCTDNAAMIASLGYFLRNTKQVNTKLNFNVDSKSTFTL